MFQLKSLSSSLTDSINTLMVGFKVRILPMEFPTILTDDNLLMSVMVSVR